MIDIVKSSKSKVFQDLVNTVNFAVAMETTNKCMVAYVSHIRTKNKNFA